MVIYPPEEEEEEVFRTEDKEDFLSHQAPTGHSGKYLLARLGSAQLGTAWHGAGSPAKFDHAVMSRAWRRKVWLS